jgi:hypothetical protein
MDVCLLYVLSGRGFCDELITRPEESYRLWRVVVRDQENLVDKDDIARTGLQSEKKKLKNHHGNSLIGDMFIRMNKYLIMKFLLLTKQRQSV